MRTWTKGKAPAALLAVAVMSLGSGTAVADTSGNGGIGSGNQIDLPISVPIDISGNSGSVLGNSVADSEGGATVHNSSPAGTGNRTSGNGGVLSGNQVNAPINLPVNACGNALAVIGNSDGSCKGGAAVHNTGKGGSGGNLTDGDGGVLSGNQIVAPITAPLNACGNAVAIFGNATAGCKGGAVVKNTGRGSGGNYTSGTGSVLGGNQVVAPITAPVNICGNAVALVGNAFAGCKGGATVSDGPGRPKGRYAKATTKRHLQGPGGNDTDGRFGVGSGNQIVIPITAPIDICGNAVGNATAGCVGGSTVDNARGGHGAGGNRTSGIAGVLSGNQAVAPITAPVDICGNAVALVGNAFAGCKGGASVSRNAHGAGGNRTSGIAGVLSGNQAVAPITAPVNVCGNAAAVLGDAAAGCLGGARAGDPLPGSRGPLFKHGKTMVKGPKGHDSGSLLPELPMVPSVGTLNGAPGAAAVTGNVQQLPERLKSVPVASGISADTTNGSGLTGVTGLTETAGLAGVADVAKVGDVAKVADVASVADTAGLGGVAKQAGLPDPGTLTDVTTVTKDLGLPELPGLPGLPGAPAKPHTPVKPGKPAKPGKHGKPVTKGKNAKPAKVMTAKAPEGHEPASGPLSVVNPATDLVRSTPVGQAVEQTTASLPVGGLMSAEQPTGLTGMNPSALVALMLGAMFAASATLFATARRIRFGRK
ncbi:hypothetical protein HNP84_010351 [Thermocatellispora tengchongensis]|uniref:Chaplin domain-containing protein n=1 Tax=Thermocatellispora tengchongensis TaxID=1073253 RepID=A0A840PNG3_9ACTN|nr:chaplin family protein [Thermocatellispora tengchongensis]MBB5140582.1 hypothetical protein [Thermocatellispora tengchongensis]